MNSHFTTYTCPACSKVFPVQITDLGDPNEHLPKRTKETLRSLQDAQTKLGADKQGDPVEEMAAKLLDQEARATLRYATCPSCSAKNPEGITAAEADRKQSLRFGYVFFGVLAIASYFLSWVALLLPLMDLFIFRPIMVVQARKTNQPFKPLPFFSGILVDVALIAFIIYQPRLSPLVPIAAIVQSLILKRPGTNDWRWADAAKKIRFETQ